jgi:undecaprenyl-diphosphatase
MDALQRRFLWSAAICLVLAAIIIAVAWSGLSQSADEAIILGFHGRGGEIVAGAMRAATFLGDGWPRSLIAAAFVIFLLVRRYARAASYILYTALGIAALNSWVLKAIVQRPRPQLVERLVDVDTSWSLPSGHAANSAAVYGAIALIAATIWWRRTQRRAIWAVAGLLILAVGISRVWLGVHWPSDVLAGWLVGAGWALGLAALLKPVQARVHTTG